MKFSKKYSILLEKCLTNPHVRHTLCSGKQKTLSHWKSRPSGRSTGTSSGPGNRLRSPLLNRLVKAGSPRWQTPLGGGAIRFKVRLVCGHPPKSGSGHGRRMRRPIRFGVPPQASYPAAVGGGERGCDTTSLTGWPKGPMITSSEDGAAGESSSRSHHNGQVVFRSRLIQQ